MASSYTPLLRLTLPTTGELQGTWGDTVNNGITSLTEAAIAGTAAIVMSDANHTLTVANGATDEARRMFVTLTGALTATRNVICPAVSKMYVVRNNTTGGQSIVFKTSAGTGITVANGQSALLYCDGANVVEAFSAFGGNAATATALQTTRTLWGQNFNGTANVTGNLSSVGNITGTASVTLTATNGSLGLAATGANIIHFLTNGTEQMRLTSTGLGIGTSSPGYKLTVAGTGGSATVSLLETGVRSWGIRAGGAASGTFDIADFTAGLTRLTLDTSGNVGIGTSSPVCKLDVQAPANGLLANFAENTSGVARRIRFSNNGTTNTIESTTGTGSTNLAFAVDGTERMRIDSAGNVGIGTSSPVTNTAPARVLHLHESSANGAAVVRYSNGTFGAGATSGGFTGYWTDNNFYVWNYANTAMNFGTNAAERMRIDSAGNLLVGTTTAAATAGGLSLSNASSAGRIDFSNVSGTTRNSCVFYFGGTPSVVGSIQTNSTSVTYNAVSDYRLKNVTGPLTGARDFILALKPKQGTWKADGSKFVGFLAHEFQEVSPSSVTGEKDAVDDAGKPVYQAMQASSAEVMANIIALLQEQQATLEAQAAEIAALKGAA